jgi:predicted SprT family Zn-dependent metalloprotease
MEFCITQTRLLFKTWNLTDWTIKFDKCCQRAGLCNSTDKVISYSRKFIKNSTEAQILNVIRHEVAHAIVGAQQGHNEVWQVTAIALGCDGKTCVAEFYPHRYRISCPCNHTKMGRYILHKSLFKKKCMLCLGDLTIFDSVKGVCVTSTPIPIPTVPVPVPEPVPVPVSVQVPV